MATLVVDTRETRPLAFRKTGIIEEIEVRKLDVGDYSIEKYEHKIAIERKSPSDLFGTLGKGHKRFAREIERAKDFDHFIILCEASFTDVINKNFEGAHYSSMRGDVIIQICYTLTMKYGVTVLFCNGRTEASSIIRNLFKAYLKSVGAK